MAATLAEIEGPMPDWILKGEQRTTAAVSAFLETIPPTASCSA